MPSEYGSPVFVVRREQKNQNFAHNEKNLDVLNKK
jgi:hypothetical protein